MRWTDGDVATLILPFDQLANNQLIRFNLLAYNCEDAIVMVNGEPRAHWNFRGCHGYEERTLALKSTDLIEKVVNISFAFPNVKTPHDLVPASEGRRKLGFPSKEIIIKK